MWKSTVCCATSKEGKPVKTKVLSQGKPWKTFRKPGEPLLKTTCFFLQVSSATFEEAGPGSHFFTSGGSTSVCREGTFMFHGKREQRAEARKTIGHKAHCWGKTVDFFHNFCWVRVSQSCSLMFTALFYLTSGVSSRADWGKLELFVSCRMDCIVSFWVISSAFIFFLQLLRSTGTVRGTLPLTVLKVLASLACHGKDKLLPSPSICFFCGYCMSQKSLFSLFSYMFSLNRCYQIQWPSK